MANNQWLLITLAMHYLWQSSLVQMWYTWKPLFFELSACSTGDSYSPYISEMVVCLAMCMIMCPCSPDPWMNSRVGSLLYVIQVTPDILWKPVRVCRERWWAVWLGQWLWIHLPGIMGWASWMISTCVHTVWVGPRNMILELKLKNYIYELSQNLLFDLLWCGIKYA